MDLSLRQVETKQDDMTDDKATTARRRNHRLATGAIGLLLAGGIAGGVLAATSATATSPSATATSPAAPSGHPEPGSGASDGSGATGGGGSNARSGPAAGGASGTIDSVSSSSFTMSTSAGQKVTVDE